jgi:hypothetical protein
MRARQDLREGFFKNIFLPRHRRLHVRALGRPRARCRPEERPRKESVIGDGVWRSFWRCRRSRESPVHGGATWRRRRGPPHA